MPERQKIKNAKNNKRIVLFFSGVPVVTLYIVRVSKRARAFYLCNTRNARTHIFALWRRCCRGEVSNLQVCWAIKTRRGRFVLIRLLICVQVYIARQKEGNTVPRQSHVYTHVRLAKGRDVCRRIRRVSPPQGLAKECQFIPRAYRPAY